MDKQFKQHISGQFNQELTQLSSHLMSLGDLVQTQVSHAIQSIADNDLHIAETVTKKERQVDDLEVEVDEACTQILVRRQPAASDLRMVLAVSRVCRDLERIGDEANKIAEYVIEMKSVQQTICQSALSTMGAEVTKMLRSALQAFSKHDIHKALEVIRTDKKVDSQYTAAIRELMTYMMEDPRFIGQGVNILWMLRAIERMGDHARNISEQVIYLVKGADVRHSSLKEMEQSIR